MTTRFHRGDLPADYQPGPSIAIDTETLGLNPHRDRLCVVQISKGDGTADVVQILKDGPPPARLIEVLADESVLKIFHYARFDLAVLFHAFGVMPRPVYCTKIASRLVRTYTDRHGLKDLVAGTARGRPLEAAAIIRLGRRHPDARPRSTTRPRTCCTSTP